MWMCVCVYIYFTIYFRIHMCRFSFRFVSLNMSLPHLFFALVECISGRPLLFRLSSVIPMAHVLKYIHTHCLSYTILTRIGLFKQVDVNYLLSHTCINGYREIYGYKCIHTHITHKPTTEIYNWTFYKNCAAGTHTHIHNSHKLINIFTVHFSIRGFSKALHTYIH